MSIPRCLTCRHPQRDEIDRLVREGEIPVREIAARFHLQKFTVQRHVKQHLAETPSALRERVVAALKEAFDAAVKVMRSNDRNGKNPQILDAADKVLKLGQPLLDRIDSARSETPKPQLVANARALIVKLAAGDPTIVREALPRVDNAVLVEELASRLSAYPDVRRKLTEASAEAVSRSFATREQALAAFENEHQELRAKFFTPPEPPLSDEEQARVVPFK